MLLLTGCSSEQEEAMKGEASIGYRTHQETDGDVTYSIQISPAMWAGITGAGTVILVFRKL